MSKVKGEYWKVNKNTFRIQIKTNKEQESLQEALPGWLCVSYGYIPKSGEDIYIFEKSFQSENDWTSFINYDKINNMIDMREVKK